MDVYLPIANLSVNGLVIVLLGFITGMSSGIFGVGGGFLTTPLLIFYGIPPTVAASTAASQVTGASVSGVFAHSRRGGVDYQMGAMTVSGGLLGALIGAGLFSLLEKLGQIDTVINILYVVLLGVIGSLMARESVNALFFEDKSKKRGPKRRHHPLIASLPMRWRFYRSGLYISPLAPMLCGLVVGILSAMMGIGGGFFLVPAMLYILGMSAQVVVGTSLFTVLFVTSLVTMTHAMTTKAVDIVLAALLLVGSVTGAQVGARIAVSIKPEWLRLMLAIIVLLVALRMLIGLSIVPSHIFSVEPL